MKRIHVIISLLAYLFIFNNFSCAVSKDDSQKGDAYWVSPTGTASWASARSDTPLSGAACCSLSTALSNASAGDTVYLRGGTYNTAMHLSRSGTADNRIVFRAYGNESPIISQSGTRDTSFIALRFAGASYVKVDGITFKNVGRWGLIQWGASYNEVSNCVFAPPAIMQFRIYRGTSGAGCVHNWIHHNIFYGHGSVGNDWNDNGYLMDVGALDYDGISNNNTIEDNVFYHGGHHLLQTYTAYNVIRNNVFHNESWMDPPANPSGPPPQQPATNGKYGNRCFAFVDQTIWNRDGVYNLAEGNRFGHAGRPPDDDGADNVEFAAHRNIFRYNYVFNAAKDGLYARATDGGRIIGSHNRIYNNTIYLNGVNESHGYTSPWRRNGITLWQGSVGNVVKNNISYSNDNYDILDGGNNTVANNWTTADGNPLFVNPDISDPMSTTLPDLRLRSGSPAIDRGAHLTRATQAGSNSTTLAVEDALYFQDGSWGSSLSDVRADWIAIGTVSNVVQIESINHATNTITLVEPRTWNAQARVWLFADSKGRRVLFGSAPDLGAYEHRISILPR